MASTQTCQVWPSVIIIEEFHSWCSLTHQLNKRKGRAIGCYGLPDPALGFYIASAMAETAWSCPPIHWYSLLARATNLSFLPSLKTGILVDNHIPSVFDLVQILLKHLILTCSWFELWNELFHVLNSSIFVASSSNKIISPFRFQ